MSYYRLWCIEEGNKEVIVRRDIMFNETIFPFLSKQVDDLNEVEELHKKHKERLSEEIQMFKNDDDNNLDYFHEGNQSPSRSNKGSKTSTF